MNASGAVARRATRQLAPGTGMALVAMGLGVLVIANDFTALNVALPVIERDFNTDVSTVQWVVNAYALIFGMAIVTGGRLADMFGRRRVFFVGTAIFAGFSLLGGAAQSAPWLIGSRVAMGVGGALMWPAILGMTYAALPEEKAGLAGGLVLGAAGIGNALGPLIGGALTDALSWRWIFFLNLPIAALAVIVTYLKVHQPRTDAEERRIDYGGIATLSSGLVLLLVGLDQAADWGFGDTRIIAMFGAAAILITAFVFTELRMRGAALVPRDVMRNRSFSSACVAVLTMSAVFFAIVLYAPQLMQKILGYSPLGSGVGMLPMLTVFAAVSFIAGPLYERIGGKPCVVAGAACLALGPFLLSTFGASSGYGALVPGLVLSGVGLGLFYPTVTTAAITALDAAHSSLAGGIVYMFQVAGGAIGLGFATVIFSTHSEDRVSVDAARAGIQLSDRQADVVHGALSGTTSAHQVLASYPPAVADKLLRVIRESFVSGVGASFRIIAAVALIGVVVSLLYVGGRLFGSSPRQANANGLHP